MKGHMCQEAKSQSVIITATQRRLHISSTINRRFSTPIKLLPHQIIQPTQDSQYNWSTKK